MSVRSVLITGHSHESHNLGTGSGLAQLTPGSNRDGVTRGLLHTSSSNALVFGLHNDNDTPGIKALNERVRDLLGEPFLHLWAVSQGIHHSWDAAEADHFLVG